MNNLRKYRKELLLKFSLVSFGVFLGMLLGILAIASIKIWLFGVILYLVIALVFCVAYNRYDIRGLDGQ